MHSPYVLQRNTCLSCEPEAMMSPVGLNLHENTSPACPVSSMMGARSPEVLAGPCNSFASSDSSASYCNENGCALCGCITDCMHVSGLLTSGLAFVLCVKAPSSTRCRFTMAPPWPLASGECARLTSAIAGLPTPSCSDQPPRPYQCRLLLSCESAVTPASLSYSTRSGVVAVSEHACPSQKFSVI